MPFINCLFYIVSSMPYIISVFLKSGKSPDTLGLLIRKYEYKQI
ncbi:hypothetical protein EAL2_c17820 [Peptoclostridium acidaminophilum DSM 3953]|uniref:Uncharacterized protein n=1 Tax=Peptoclostridium acidaminophilum DSM 3953 TaxID=1286171 RepID=W8T5Q2_PEPAC|nr:hypothetical protein EAL2_c17820 [Peptoclostridium acidaminophilum DSM 3953]